LLYTSKQSTSINLQMLENGAAWVFSRYQKDKTWQDAQETAKQKAIGLWQNTEAMAPWEWRNRKSKR